VRPGDGASGHFLAIADWLTGQARPGELLTAYLRGEESDFVRISQGQVRQAGHVAERELTVALADGQRQACATVDLTGVPRSDRALLAEQLVQLRQTLPQIPEDPYLNAPDVVRSTSDVHPTVLPEPAEALAELLASARDLDLVGLWASGPVYAGFASSAGQRNWFERATFHVDWSLHGPDGAAVKAVCAGERWEPAVILGSMARARRHLELSARPRLTPRPGRYRAYLAPAALRELLAVLAHGGFGLKDRRTGQTPLLRMLEQGYALHPAVSLDEAHSRGLGPRFTRAGFVLPDTVPLVTAGRLGDALADARSAREYGVAVNASEETPRALTMTPGDLAMEAALPALGTGLYVGNLWYCNFSDRNDCRITGMTRFACFRVEGGEVQGPIAPMRFDDSLVGLLGERLLAITREQELLPDAGTYEGRSTASMRLPGALVDDLRLTL